MYFSSGILDQQCDDKTNAAELELSFDGQQLAKPNKGTKAHMLGAIEALKAI